MGVMGAATHTPFAYLLCEAAALQPLYLLRSFASCRCRVRHASSCPAGRCRSHSFATYRLANGARITSVINWSPLQRLSRMLDGTLRRFVAEAAFDLAIVSAPHPECFFDWLHNRSLPWCVDHY